MEDEEPIIEEEEKERMLEDTDDSLDPIIHEIHEDEKPIINETSPVHQEV